MSKSTNRERWLALTAALLGWMFDGLEMGLFPLVARPAIRDLLQTTDDKLVSQWFSVATACFLIGAATGGVLFGWLGDSIGRVRAMTLSVLTYALFTGLCGFARSPLEIAVLRFASALGMGGEWSLGVALVMEIWPDRSRALMAGLIGAAANVGYLLIALLSWQLGQAIAGIGNFLLMLKIPEQTVFYLIENSAWRFLMMVGALPALLTFFIRLAVPESRKWEEEQAKGATTSWAKGDLLGVLVGAVAACTIIYLQIGEAAWLIAPVRIVGSLACFGVALLGYLHPVRRYLHRSAADAGTSRFIVKRMLLGACLSGVPLLGTWASIQWAPIWADQLSNKLPEARAFTQMCSAAGAVLGTILAALAGDWLGRKLTYTILCLASVVTCLAFFQLNTAYGVQFLVLAFLAGGVTASFYGWLPLYLPELFGTAVRATGQGFSFNFGRILAAVGTLQTAIIMGSQKDPNYPQACSVMSAVYFFGLVFIAMAPETKGKPLPD